MSNPGRLVDEVRSLDASAEELSADSRCEWVRCAFAIIGRVRIRESGSPDALDREISEEVAHALAQIDRVPDRMLTQDELWNLVLFIAVPWPRAQSESEVAKDRVLARWARNTAGCRKLILWADSSIAAHVGPLSSDGEAWVPEGDILGDLVGREALSEEERRWLQILFKRRFDPGDAEQLIRVLGEPPHDS